MWLSKCEQNIKMRTINEQMVNILLTTTVFHDINRLRTLNIRRIGMKKILSLTLVLVLSLSAFSIRTQAVEENVILNDDTGIPDKYLYRTILKTLGKNDNETFTKEEASAINELVAGNSLNKEKIKSIKGIGNLSALTYLYISSNEITSLEGVEQLTNLRSLYVSNNYLTDINPISNLYKLESLDISNNNINSLNPIENLTELSSLVAMRLQLKELPDLKKLTNLTGHHTYFQYNKLSKKELKIKCPAELIEDEGLWLKDQVKFQNVNEILKIKKPKSVKKISKKTKKIVGKTHKGAMVKLITIKNQRQKTIRKVKTNKNGTFTFKNLDLKKMKGKKMIIRAYMYASSYQEEWTLKAITFRVKK